MSVSPGHRDAASEDGASRIREVGIPVRSVNWVRLHAGRDRVGRDCLYAAMGQESEPLFVLQIDPETGSCRQFGASVADANFPTASLMSRSGILYLGSSYAGHLLCFDPETDEVVDRGAIHPEAATFPCRMDEDADGVIWIGSYGTADLTSYDPASATFTPRGRMDETDMYNYPLVGAGGTIANLIRVTRSFVVVYDPRSGERRQVGPVAAKGEDELDLFRGDDGNLYIESTLGNFRLDGADLEAVSELPARMPDRPLPDGSTFAFVDAGEQIYHTLGIRHPDGSEKRFALDYTAGGSRIFYIHKGPDDCVYGSSILPLHLFRYNPRDGELADLGQCSSATGEAYSMANLGDRLYISSYPQAILSVYEPARPYRFGDGEDANPRNLGRIDDLSYRPRSTLAGPLGRVWTASIPDYGRWGGPLSWYDPQSGERHAYYDVAGDGSCYTLAWLEELQLMAVGTTIDAGSGTEPRADQAVLFLWDYEREEKIWEGTLDLAVNAFNALVVAADGRIFGTVHGAGGSRLFVFDVGHRRFSADCLELPGKPLDLGLQVGPEGILYGFTDTCIYRLDPASLRLEVVVRDEEEGFRTAGPIVGDEIMCGRNHRLMAVRID